MKTGRWILAGLSVLGLSMASNAADWPQFRGPQRTGVSSETGLLKEWPKEGPKLVWHARDIGDGYATPALAGNRLYLLSSRGLDNEFVQALSTGDGKQIWATKIGKVGNPEQRPSFPTSRSTPTVEGDVLYALGSDGDLACLETAGGKVRWQKNLRAEFGGRPGQWAYSESPLIDGDALVVTPGGAQAAIVALNKKTGALIWKVAVPGADPAAYASIIIFEAGGRKQYAQYMENGVVAVDAKTGQFLWRYDGTKSITNIPTLVAGGGQIYTSGRAAGALLRPVAAEGGWKAEEVYKQRGLPSSNGGSVLVGKVLYGTGDQGLVAVDFATGKPFWANPGIGAASVLHAEGRLYLHGENGDVALVEATSEGYREKGRFTPPNQPKHVRGGMEKAWPYPVVANGRLYIRDLDSLWCYDVGAR
jgi:outer membrane protein assembly factor BamB